METDFMYNGLKFRPLGKLKKTPFSNIILNSEAEQTKYTYKSFYAAANNCNKDIFLCLDNHFLYVPCSNELYRFSGYYNEIKYEQLPKKEGSLPQWKIEINSKTYGQYATICAIEVRDRILYQVVVEDGTIVRTLTTFERAKEWTASALLELRKEEQNGKSNDSE